MSLTEKLRKGVMIIGLTGLIGGLSWGAYNGVVGEWRSNVSAYSEPNKEYVEATRNNYRERNKGGLIALGGLALIAASQYKKKEHDNDEMPH